MSEGRTAIDQLRLAAVQAEKGDEIEIEYIAASSGTQQRKIGEVLETHASHDERLDRHQFSIEFEAEANIYSIVGSTHDDEDVEDSQPSISSVRFHWHNGERSGRRGTRRVSERRGVTNVTLTQEDDEVRTDGGCPEEDEDEYPREYGSAGQEAGTVLDAFDDLEAGDRVLWGDRKQPCTVARVVEPNDRVGQTLTASVISASNEWLDAHDSKLRNGDVFLSPGSWGTMTGKRFVVIQGPRGGFYALAEPERNRTYPALFRAVRSYHRTKAGQPGQGAFRYEQDFDTALKVVEPGPEPEELDPEGDLPSYEDIAQNRVMGYDGDSQEHYEVGTVESVFDEGLHNAHDRAEAEFSNDEEEEEEDPVPSAERWKGTPDGYSHSTVKVTAIVQTSDGLKAVLETPAPWETPDDEKPANEVIKSTPWDQVEYEFDYDREAWLVNASELVNLASTFRFHGYSVYDARDE